MKRVFVIRHAKSDQRFFGNDFDRPLNDRGNRDAPGMARRLIDTKIKVDAFISSPAKRAKRTAEIFVQEFGLPAESIIFVDELYHAPAPVFYKVISELPGKYDSVALFSHNPGITSFVNSLGTGIKTDNMPTCAIYGVEADIENWIDFANAKKQLILFDFPKNN
jgi:phosphohistidine phosphatase